MANDVEIEKLTLLTYRMEELAYTWERQLNLDYDAPSSYTNEDFNKWLGRHPLAGRDAQYIEGQEKKWGIMDINSFEAENLEGFSDWQKKREVLLINGLELGVIWKIINLFDEIWRLHE